MKRSLYGLGHGARHDSIESRRDRGDSALLSVGEYDTRSPNTISRHSGIFGYGHGILFAARLPTECNGRSFSSYRQHRCTDPEATKKNHCYPITIGEKTAQGKYINPMRSMLANKCGLTSHG